MERLTCMAQGYCEMYCENYDCCFAEPETCKYSKQVQLYEKLRDYERTGLSPEEVRDYRNGAVVKGALAAQEAALYDGSALARADEEIARLEKELAQYKQTEREALFSSGGECEENNEKVRAVLSEHGIRFIHSADKEKMIELIQDAVGGCARYWAEQIANHLILNGVIFATETNCCSKESGNICSKGGQAP